MHMPSITFNLIDTGQIYQINLYLIKKDTPIRSNIQTIDNTLNYTVIYFLQNQKKYILF